jgi:hypothetical protein
MKLLTLLTIVSALGLMGAGAQKAGDAAGSKVQPSDSKAIVILSRMM